MQHRVAAARADRHRLDLDVFHLARLRDGDGEAFWIADAAGDAFDEMGEGLRLGELDEAAHPRGFKPFDAGDGADHASGVVCRCASDAELVHLEIEGRMKRTRTA